jgi:hypothetical protein
MLPVYIAAGHGVLACLEKELIQGPPRGEQKSEKITTTPLGREESCFGLSNP